LDNKKSGIFRSPNAVSITSFTPVSTTAGTMTTLTINGSGFGATQGSGKVEFKNADNGGSGYMSPIQDEYVSWSNTKIKVKVPSGAGTGTIRVTNNAGSSAVSSSDITIKYNVNNIIHNSKKHRTNLVDADGSGGIEFEFYTDFYNNDDARDAFERALGTWRCSNYGGTGVYFADGGSSTVDVNESDGVNIVRFDSGNDLNPNELGRMTSRYEGCSYGGDPIKWYVKELDIMFDSTPGSGGSYTWNFDEADGTTGSNQYDFESVAVHEIGHGHELGHVIDATQIMHYAISNGQEKRELSSDDLDGGNDVLDFSGSTCGKPEMDVFVCAVLPLRLVEFRAKANGEKVDLKWEFDNIRDLDYLALERSIDGINFNTIKRFSPKTGSANLFDYTDYPGAKEVYYRLKVFDEDGSYFDSKKLFVFLKDGISKVEVYPNPFGNSITIENNTKENVEIEIYNNCGNAIHQIRRVERSDRLIFDLQNIPKGIYLVKIISPSGINYKKIVKR